MRAEVAGARDTSHATLRGTVVVGAAAMALRAIACNLLVSPEDLTGASLAPDDAGAPNDGDDAGAPNDGGDSSSSAGLVAHWNFDEGQGTMARDQSGMGNDAVLIGGASWAPGRIRGAIAFDGDSGRAKVAESSSLRLTDELTIAFWANLDAVPHDPRIISKPYAYEIKFNGRNPQLNSGSGYATMGVQVPPGEWHHIAFTFGCGSSPAAECTAGSIT